MWAQLITVRLKSGREDELIEISNKLRAIEQPGSGFVRHLVMRDQKDPLATYFLAVFESEEKARARERDPRREEGLAEVRAQMAEIFEGAPEFVDLIVDGDVEA